MANEITITMSAALSNGSNKDSFSPGQQKVNQVTPLTDSGILACTTSPAVITMSNCTTLGWGFFINLDGTNTVQLLSGTTVFANLLPGEACAFPLTPATTYKAQTIASTAKLWYRVWNR